VSVDHLVCYDDFLAAARDRLDRDAFDYFRSGALTEWTLRENEAAFARWRFHKRVMVDVSTIDATTSVLGTDVAFPVLVAPTAFHKLADPEGEIATARATRAVDTVMVNSTLSTIALEEVAATDVKRWFQLYILKDRSHTERMIERAVASGFTAIVLTVDTPMIGIRYADQRNRFQLPSDMTMATLESNLPDSDASGLRAFTDLFDQSLTWDAIEWICEAAELPVIAKGILTDVDARRAIDAGAAGVIVSNHGGRQLDGDPATLDALPEVVAEVGRDTTVLLDGGIRTGPDVVKALCLGADAVLVGRPVLWGLAAGGEAGVERVLSLLRDEVVDTLRQLGAPSLADLGPHLVRPIT
jgi:isopentenyl diphosphate isomerase/L-lactate dehydrogenase-like FMN-dependent dehydrogenase